MPYGANLLQVVSIFTVIYNRRNSLNFNHVLLIESYSKVLSEMPT